MGLVKKVQKDVYSSITKFALNVQQLLCFELGVPAPPKGEYCLPELDKTLKDLRVQNEKKAEVERSEICSLEEVLDAISMYGDEEEELFAVQKERELRLLTLEGVFGDLKYLLEMQEMDDAILRGDGPKGKLQMTHVVPIGGQVLGRIHVIEMEHQTVLDLWDRYDVVSPAGSPPEEPLSSTALAEAVVREANSKRETGVDHKLSTLEGRSLQRLEKGKSPAREASPTRISETEAARTGAGTGIGARTGTDTETGTCTGEGDGVREENRDAEAAGSEEESRGTGVIEQIDLVESEEEEEEDSEGFDESCGRYTGGYDDEDEEFNKEKRRLRRSIRGTNAIAAGPLVRHQSIITVPEDSADSDTKGSSIVDGTEADLVVNSVKGEGIDGRSEPSQKRDKSPFLPREMSSGSGGGGAASKLSAFKSLSRMWQQNTAAESSGCSGSSTSSSSPNSIDQVQQERMSLLNRSVVNLRALILDDQKENSPAEREKEVVASKKAKSRSTSPFRKRRKASDKLSARIDGCPSNYRNEECRMVGILYVFAGGCLSPRFVCLTSTVLVEGEEVVEGDTTKITMSSSASDSATPHLTNSPPLATSPTTPHCLSPRGRGATSLFLPESRSATVPGSELDDIVKIRFLRLFLLADCTVSACTPFFHILGLPYAFRLRSFAGVVTYVARSAGELQEWLSKLSSLSITSGGGYVSGGAVPIIEESHISDYLQDILIKFWDSRFLEDEANVQDDSFFASSFYAWARNEAPDCSSESDAALLLLGLLQFELIHPVNETRESILDSEAVSPTCKFIVVTEMCERIKEGRASRLEEASKQEGSYPARVEVKWMNRRSVSLTASDREKFMERSSTAMNLHAVAANSSQGTPNSHNSGSSFGSDALRARLQQERYRKHRHVGNARGSTLVLSHMRTDSSPGSTTDSPIFTKRTKSHVDYGTRRSEEGPSRIISQWVERKRPSGNLDRAAIASPEGRREHSVEGHRKVTLSSAPLVQVTGSEDGEEEIDLDSIEFVVTEGVDDEEEEKLKKETGERVEEKGEAGEEGEEDGKHEDEKEEARKKERMKKEELKEGIIEKEITGEGDLEDETVKDKDEAYVQDIEKNG